MTREEREEAARIIKECKDKGFKHTFYTLNEYHTALDTAIKALEQEPCEDEYIKVPKKALKYRTAGMVAYNAEWLKNHFDIERTVICGAKEPCDNAISRQAVEKITWEEPSYTDALNVLTEVREKVRALPPVTPQPKIGHWVEVRNGRGGHGCDVCNDYAPSFQSGDEYLSAFCPNCGAMMVEPQERSNEE